jgi:hypothetical protein
MHTFDAVFLCWPGLRFEIRHKGPARSTIVERNRSGIDKFVRTTRRWRIVKTKPARRSFMYRVAELMCTPIHHDIEAARQVLQDDAS